MRKLIDLLAALAVAASLLAMQVVPSPAQEPVVPGSVSQPANGNSQAFLPFSSSNALSTKQGSLTPLGYCQLSVTSAAQTSTCSGGIPSGTVWALICNEGAAARWRDDGTAPTTSVGMPVGTGTAGSPACFNYFGNFAALDWIAQTGTSVLDFSFYK
jgi:hypothetical protein